MDVVTVLGSPRKQGNTASVLSSFEELARARGHGVERIHTIDHRIGGCTGCAACQKGEDLAICVQPDDGPTILRRLVGAEVIVYATPLYCWSYASQMKPLLDRHLSLTAGFRTPQHRSALAGKRLALLVTCGGPAEGNADLVQLAFDRFAGGLLQASSVRKYVVPGCRPLDPGRAQEAAWRMVAELTGMERD